jgi:hypothetical protein
MRNNQAGKEPTGKKERKDPQPYEMAELANEKKIVM